MTTTAKAKAAPACQPRHPSRRKRKKHHAQGTTHDRASKPAQTRPQQGKAHPKQRKRHRRKKPHKCAPAKHSSTLTAGLPGVSAAPAIPANPPPPSSTPPPSVGAPLTLDQAYRLLWRAG